MIKSGRRLRTRERRRGEMPFITLKKSNLFVLVYGSLFPDCSWRVHSGVGVLADEETYERCFYY